MMVYVVGINDHADKDLRAMQHHKTVTYGAEEDVLIDYDATGHVLGVEIIDAIGIHVDGQQLTDIIEKAWMYDQLTK